jgi:hypothetical protein
MPVKYACFISYRHSRVSERSLLKRVTDYLYKALCSEIEALTSKQVAIDLERLKGGQFYNEQIASDLCKSACLIVVYSPTYFDHENTYCAREYLAMEDLEVERRKLFKDPDLRNYGVIIPIVFRGFDYLPEGIKSKRLCFDFKEFDEYETDRELGRRYGKQIRMIADYVVKCCNTFEAVADDICVGCEEFDLPSEERVRPWLTELKSTRPARAPFPGRTG